MGPSGITAGICSTPSRVAPMCSAVCPFAVVFTPDFGRAVSRESPAATGWASAHAGAIASVASAAPVSAPNSRRENVLALDAGIAVELLPRGRLFRADAADLNLGARVTLGTDRRAERAAKH